MLRHLYADFQEIQILNDLQTKLLALSSWKEESEKQLDDDETMATNLDHMLTTWHCQPIGQAM